MILGQEILLTIQTCCLVGVPGCGGSQLAGSCNFLLCSGWSTAIARELESMLDTSFPNELQSIAFSPESCAAKSPKPDTRCALACMYVHNSGVCHQSQSMDALADHRSEVRSRGRSGNVCLSGEPLVARTCANPWWSGHDWITKVGGGFKNEREASLGKRLRQLGWDFYPWCSPQRLVCLAGTGTTYLYSTYLYLETSTPYKYSPHKLVLISAVLYDHLDRVLHLT